MRIKTPQMHLTKNSQLDKSHYTSSRRTITRIFPPNLSIIIYRTKATAAAPSTEIKLAPTTPAPPVYCAGLPVVVALGDVVLVPETRTKLAQVILVVLAKWRVIDRFPKKDPKPGTKDAYGST